MMSTTLGCCGSSKKSACWIDISAAICFKPSDYNGAAMVTSATCDQYAANVGLTSTTNQCGDATLKEKTNIMATVLDCCGSDKKSACWEAPPAVDVSSAVCLWGAAYLPHHTFIAKGFGGQETTCAAMATQLKFTATAQCDAAMQPNAAIMAAFGCCGDSKIHFLRCSSFVV